MEQLLVYILIFYFAAFLVQSLADVLNLLSFKDTLPEEFADVYESDKYQQSAQYLKSNTIIGLIEASFSTLIIFCFVLSDGFNVLDIWVRNLEMSEIVSGLIFIGVLTLGSQLLFLPFGIYKTFVIEKRFGFNKTTPGTYALDQIKGLFVMIIFGAPLLSGILGLFLVAGDWAWLFAWGFVSVFQLTVMFIAPVFIMPLFNKFEPLEEGQLKQEIEAYAKKEDFKLKGVYKMDGSKRSSKTNAFFTGLGKFRRIVLFDTLIEKHPVKELLAVVAHEMGHYKKNHILKTLVSSIVLMGLMFFALSICLAGDWLFEAFNMDDNSVYVGLVLFSFIYSPISMVIGLISSAVSRKHEFEADAYAAASTGLKSEMISALKTLSVENLSNLTPHPLKVWLGYSHPPVLQRIRALENRD